MSWWFKHWRLDAFHTQPWWSMSSLWILMKSKCWGSFKQYENSSKAKIGRGARHQALSSQRAGLGLEDLSWGPQRGILKSSRQGPHAEVLSVRFEAPYALVICLLDAPPVQILISFMSRWIFLTLDYWWRFKLGNLWSVLERHHPQNSC